MCIVQLNYSVLVISNFDNGFFYRSGCERYRSEKASNARVNDCRLGLSLVVGKSKFELKDLKRQHAGTSPRDLIPSIQTSLNLWDKSQRLNFDKFFAPYHQNFLTKVGSLHEVSSSLQALVPSCIRPYLKESLTQVEGCFCVDTCTRSRIVSLCTSHIISLHTERNIRGNTLAIWNPRGTPLYEYTYIGMCGAKGYCFGLK